MGEYRQNTTGLTGRVRYRLLKQLFRKPVLVLQVEEHFNEMMLLGGWPERMRGLRWRDARVEDLG